MNKKLFIVSFAVVILIVIALAYYQVTVVKNKEVQVQKSTENQLELDQSIMTSEFTVE